jgi:hypothetical protein
MYNRRASEYEQASVVKVGLEESDYLHKNV